jgi:hypothetical protein
MLVLLSELPVPEDAPPAAPEVLLLGLPLEPLPVVMPSSFRHFSRSAPCMPRHLLLDELAPEELVPGEGVAGEGVPAPVLLPAAPLALLPDAP